VRGGGGGWRIHNQFNSDNFTSKEGVKTPHGTLNVSSDGIGFGIGQITATTYKPPIVETRFVWDWREHIYEMGRILMVKLDRHNDFMKYYKNAYGVTPPKTFTYKGATLTPAQWGTAVLFNGKKKIASSKAKDDGGNWKDIPSPFAYVNGTWKIHENSQNYAEKIAKTKKDVDSGTLKIKE
jgi:hypothetical protein